MGYYLIHRAEIKAQLEAVSGIGKVYDTRRNPTTLDEYKQLYSIGGVINTCFITRMAGVELENGIASMDEADKLNFVQKEDNWELELRYGFSEDAGSETIYGNLCDAIEAKFRFLEGLNNKAYRSFPLQRTQAGLFKFLDGLVMCHVAIWILKIQERVENPNPET